MFVSSGYFKGVFCPFYQYGLCHRPYCHFKHVKAPVLHDGDNDTEKKKSPVASPVTKNSPNNEDDVMRIVKNIPPAKLMEYAKRQQEEKQLRITLELIDKENKEKEKSIRSFSASSSDGDNASGLIDAFYNKSKVVGTFTSHDNLNDTSEKSLNDITPVLNLPKERRICECDDPDCSGFIEEEEKEQILLATTEDTKEEAGSNTLLSQEEKVKKLSDVDFFGCPSASKNTIRKRKRKKRISNEKDDEELKSNGSVSETKKRNKDVADDENETKRKKKKSVDKSKFKMVFLKEGEPDKSTKKKKIESKTGVKENDYISVDSIPTTGQGSGKKRLAHSNEEVGRARVQHSKCNTKKLSYISPGLSAPVPSNKPAEIPVVIPEVPASMGLSTDSGVYVGKKRQAHVFTPPVEKVKRPRLPMETGGKVPHQLRQRYLDKIIDEFVLKCESERIAIEKGFSEEAVAHQRSSRKQIYMNLCASIIKKIRGMPAYVPPEPIHEEATTLINPMKTAEPTVHSVSRIKGGSISGYKKVSSQNSLSKKTVKPASSSLVNAVKSDVKLLPAKTTQRRMSGPVELTEETLFGYLNQFILTNGQRWENNYPRRHAEDPELAEFKDYKPEVNPLKRMCCRCGKEYFMNKKGKYITSEECRFHWGRLRKRRERGTLYSFFSCCDSDGNAEPCSISRLHVCDRMGPLTNFVSTDSWSNEDTSRKVFSIDCEMSYTTQGLELTRVTVVDFNMEQTVDLFVKPDNPIVDYNTRFSGVTKEHLKSVDTTLHNIHEIFMNLFDRNTILMGHSLESDLKALKIIHNNVVDTALVFPHRLGLPFKRALRTLMGEYLQKIIQDGEGGHDSCEDARACMQLMRYKFNEDTKKQSRPHVATNSISSSSFYAAPKL